MSKYMYMVKKRLVWVVLERGERDKYNETDLKEEEVIKLSTKVASIYAMHALFRF